MHATSIVAYLALFASVGFLFLLVALLLGRFLRAQAPTPEKLQPYECGEPSVGTSFVQFDLRYYVVALVFIVFEVELAFFFPWAAVFGKTTRAMSPAPTALAPVDQQVVRPAEPEQMRAVGPAPDWTHGLDPAAARRLSLAAIADMGVFFAVLLLGFAYVWWRGDLDWVRATGHLPLRVRDRSRPQPLVGPVE